MRPPLHLTLILLAAKQAPALAPPHQCERLWAPRAGIPPQPFQARLAICPDLASIPPRSRIAICLDLGCRPAGECQAVVAPRRDSHHLRHRRDSSRTGPFSARGARGGARHEERRGERRGEARCEARQEGRRATLRGGREERSS